MKYIEIDGMKYSLPEDAQTRAILINHLDLATKGIKEYVTLRTLHEGRKIQLSARHLQAVGGYELHMEKLTQQDFGLF